MKINELDIQIDRAEVNKVSISLENGDWGISVSGKLISSTGQEVTTFSYSSDGWENTKIEFPIEAIGLGRKLFELAQPIIIKKIQGHFRALGSGE